MNESAADAVAAPTAPTPPVVAGPSPLMRDALVTIVTRFGLAILIFATDIALARLLGPSAKGRFTLVLLYSQLAALIVGLGMDQALAVVAGRDRATARRGMANAILWTAVVGGFSVFLSGWLYGLPTVTRPDGPLTVLIPNLSAAQFTYAALALPGELFFAIGLYALLGSQARRLVQPDPRRAPRAPADLRHRGRGDRPAQPGPGPGPERRRPGRDGRAILWVAARTGASGSGRRCRSWPRSSASVCGRCPARSPSGSSSGRTRSSSTPSSAFAQTGIYSVTSGLAEALWYVPNALGTVMFSRAVDPKADSGRIAAVLTRTTIAVALVTAIPAFIIGPRLVRFVYGSAFADAGVALRLILPGIVAYSVVAVLSRYIVGGGRPGTEHAHHHGRAGDEHRERTSCSSRATASAARPRPRRSRTSLTAALDPRRLPPLSGRGWRETLVIRRTDIAALVAALRAIFGRLTGRRHGPLVGLRGGDEAADLVIGEREPGEER